MIGRSDVIVIGSGGLGAATAYYLTKHKGLGVTLVDKHDIGSQTSPRAAGMVSGLSISPAVGEALATWIVDGKPSIDLSPMSVTRFKDQLWSEPQLQREAAWQYRHFYGAV
ncbi:FAD-dependent oxidoreductase [Bradyrhizobium erythrophlei]|uniref:FAD-dependent oxidoreductase n=1 Tax=Bradyrhizobium erythrophlei TaxID=1437360 RepID=UPI0035EE1DAB